MRFSRSICRMVSTLRITSLHTCPGRRARSSENTIAYFMWFLLNGKQADFILNKAVFLLWSMNQIYWGPTLAFLLFLLCYRTECCLWSISYFSLLEKLVLTIQPGPSCHGMTACFSAKTTVVAVFEFTQMLNHNSWCYHPDHGGQQEAVVFVALWRSTVRWRGYLLLTGA